MSGSDGWEARMAARSQQRAEANARARREALEAQAQAWATADADDIPAEFRDHHHHVYEWGHSCSCGWMGASVAAYVVVGSEWDDGEPLRCAACGAVDCQYAGPPRHDPVPPPVGVAVSGEAR